MLVAKEVDGIQMGVLEDGTPFLTGLGLAQACGVPRSVIYGRAKDWADGKRDGRLARLLQDAGFDEPLMYTPLDDGRVHAYTDSVCTIVIEYYALDATPTNIKAKDTLRRLTRHGLRQYIYKSVGYDPKTVLPRGWREFQDRLLLSTYPPGYFSVFREMADFLLRAIQAGLRLDAKSVPDISVGQTWGPYWDKNDLAAKFGASRRHEHNYPPHYPQAASNPQDVRVYPIEALGVFRKWLEDVYIPDKFPAYLEGQIKKRAIDRASAVEMIKALTPAALAAEDDDEAA